MLLIVYIKGSTYRIHFAVNIMNGSQLVDKRGLLYFFFIIYKISEHNSI